MDDSRLAEPFVWLCFALSISISLLRAPEKRKSTDQTINYNNFIEAIF